MYISANTSGSGCPLEVSPVFRDCPRNHYHQCSNQNRKNLWQNFDDLQDAACCRVQPGRAEYKQIKFSPNAERKKYKNIYVFI